MMDESNLEERENESENTVVDELNFRRNRCRLYDGNSDATGVYLDLLRRANEMRTEVTAANAAGQSSLADTVSENLNRASTSHLSREPEICEVRQIEDTETSVETILPLSEPFVVISRDGNICSVENQPYIGENGPPPSYTSLPPPIPAIVLPPIIHPPPPPTYEQTFGLRYLDRDQPVLVFNTENMWGYRPQLAYCRSCNAMVLTNVQSQSCQATHFAAVLSFLLCCWPCCVLPYFIPALKEAIHYCPACNSHLGTYHPFSRTT